jgi:hypothetical protein
MDIGKKKIKLSLFAEDKLPYKENPKESSKTLLELVNISEKLQNTNSTYKNQ